MTKYQFSNKVQKIAPSATMAMAQKAKEMSESGIDVINLSQGEPDFTTPSFIAEAAKSAIDSGKASFYTPTLGMKELRTAIANSYQELQKLSYLNIGVATGAKLVLYSLLQVLIDPGDAVVTSAPYWVSYKQQVKLADGEFFAINPLNKEMKLTVNDLDNLKFVPKAIILNNPTNPTGAVYNKEELVALISWAEKHDVYLILDEIYGKLVYNSTEFISSLELAKINGHKLIIVDGVSKSYAMTGWRIGWAIADPKIISELGKVLSHITSNPTTVAQYAAMAAVKGDGKSVANMRETFEKRLNTTYDLLVKIPEIKLTFKPEGAFYFFFEVSPEAIAQHDCKNTTELAMDILDKVHLALPAGEGFGMPGFLRMSYAKDQSTINEGVKRLQEYFKK